MTKKTKTTYTSFIATYLIISLIGCSIAWDTKKNPPLDREQLISPVASIIDEQWEVVIPVIEEYEGEIANRMSRNGASNGIQVVTSMLEEEKGEEYLRFAHALTSGENSITLLALAENLIDEEDMTQLEEQIVEVRARILELGELQSRALPHSQREPFLRDLQKLLTKTIVLLIAGIVYAAIPKVIFWGKITAAAAVATAAGIVATTVMSIYRYYEYGDNMGESFQEWIVDVTTDPSAAFALATSMITVGKTMNNGPVVTGLIIVVFAIYQVLDLVKPMLLKYNFDA